MLMLGKAGLIIAVFMHMAWERLALSYAILVPPVLVLIFVVDHGVRGRLHLLHPHGILRRGPLGARTCRALMRRCSAYCAGGGGLKSGEKVAR